MLPHNRRGPDHQDWSPQRFVNWAKDIGPGTLEVVQSQLKDRPHPEHGYLILFGSWDCKRPS
jgi:hypothetical protein